MNKPALCMCSFFYFLCRCDLAGERDGLRPGTAPLVQDTRSDEHFSPYDYAIVVLTEVIGVEIYVSMLVTSVAGAA